MARAIGLAGHDRSPSAGALISSHEMRSPVSPWPSTSTEVTALSGTCCPSSQHQLKGIDVAPDRIPRRNLKAGTSVAKCMESSDDRE